MKAIFLDVDGVMISQQHLMSEYEAGRSTLAEEITLQPSAVDCLCRLVETTGARIVVSSTYRRIEDGLHNIGRQLYMAGGKAMRIYSTTPVLSGCNIRRSAEIKAWLSQNEVESYVVLDDETVDDLNDHLVKCNRFYGFGQNELDLAIKMLQ
jgi:hypothetical protein